MGNVYERRTKGDSVFQLSHHLQLHYTDIATLVPIPMCEHRLIHEL
jgi:hypothetical protein